MPGKSKRAESRDDTTEGAVPAPQPIELTDGLAIPNGLPEPITFLGKAYSVRRGYSPNEVLNFFNLSQQHKYDEILEMVICEGDPAQLWDDIGTRSVPEMLHVYLPTIYKLAGFMSPQGEFLAL